MSIGGIDSYSSIYYARQPGTVQDRMPGESLQEAGPPSDAGKKPQSADSASKTGAQADPEAKKTQRSDGKTGTKDLTPEEQKELESLKKRDTEVRQHEQSHLAAGGQYVKGGPTYSYQSGPDGHRYAVGGEVQIDKSPVPGDPEATIRKMQTIKMAALAPATPSAQDYSVAAAAANAAAKAALEKMKQSINKMGAGGEGPSDSKGASLDVRI